MAKTRTRRIDVSPDASGDIRAKQHDTTVTHSTVITEMVANSLDANAENISLMKLANAIVFEDDGDGCADLGDMVRIGKSQSRGYRDRIGRYGQGFTNSVIRVGQRIHVDTMTADGVKASTIISFAEMIKHNEWVMHAAQAGHRTSKGMTIECRDFFEGGLTFSNWGEYTRKEIQKYFATALRRGVNIYVDHKPVPAPSLPELTREVSLEGLFEDKPFTLRAGLLKDNRRAQSGWNIHWGDLLIMGDYVKHGFGNMQPGGFYGVIELRDSEKARWNLSTKKDEVIGITRLLDDPRVQELIVPLLLELRNARQQVPLQLNTRVLDRINDDLGKGVQQRVEEAEHGIRLATRKRRGPPKPDPVVPAPGPVDGVPDSKKLYVVKDTGSKLRSTPALSNLTIVGTENPSRGIAHCELSDVEGGGFAITATVYNDKDPAKSLWDTGQQHHYALMAFARWIAENRDHPLGKKVWYARKLDEVPPGDVVSVVNLWLIDIALCFSKELLKEAA